ncbi:hypothetical protein CDV36_005081 [Fusarium kuroshium]|uniref:Alpha-1,2-mannosyltransferase n=1 Tax=Fusarium kuroshium TaxID=2010991 RepID=A0A3M2SCH9_9HYPO|nr:hypothetical protein CDV36_005081 [Fusarium kuroshium]
MRLRIDISYFNTGLVLLAFGAFAAVIFSLVRARLGRGKLQNSGYSQHRQHKLTARTAKNSASDSSYTNVFPPSQRAAAFSSDPEADLSSGSKHVLEMDKDYRLANPSSYIFSGFSIKEILSLGDFPDYAKLSGVPLPSPLPNFNVDKAVPRPYRPLRWVYHQTMAFKKMNVDFWIELESTYRERMRQRQEVCAKHGKEVIQALPGSELACKELMEMVIQFICTRYPNQFQLIGTTLVNHILETKHNLKEHEPLHILRDNVPEDFAITLRDEKTGHYIFRAGIICSSIGWNLGRKMNQDLDVIHGPVPEYKEKMAFSMNRFFSKMPASNPIQRGSWGLSQGQPLYLPGDPGKASLKYRDAPNPSLKPEGIFLRTDWQTLRRLPLSGAVVFNFKVLFTPITEFEDEPYIPSLMLKVLNEGKENLMEHKATRHVEHVTKPTLEMYERLQIEKGLIPRDWEPRTLDESPFFPTWEKKWRTS